jgi:hypothetical protein
MQTQSNLEEDGMGVVIQAYLDAAGKKKGKMAKSKKTPKKRSSARTKTPKRPAAERATGKTPKNAKTPKKAEAPAASAKKKNKKLTKKAARTKTPTRSSNKKKARASAKKKKKAQFSEPVQEEADAKQGAVEYVSTRAEVQAARTTASSNASLDITGGYVWWGGYVCAICVFLVLSYLELNCSDPEAPTSNICQAEFVAWVQMAKMVSSALPTLLALWGVMQLPAHDSALARFVAAGFVWTLASQTLAILPRLPIYAATEAWHLSLLNTLSLASGVLAQIFFVYAFSQKQYELAAEPLWSPSRAVPFAIIGYFIVTEELKAGGTLREAYDAREADPLSCLLLFGAVAATCFAGWRAATRVGYGGVGWRSRRATKQILGVVGALSMAFVLMIEFQGKPVLGWPILANDLMRSMYAHVAMFVGVGMYAASALMHVSDA